MPRRSRHVLAAAFAVVALIATTPPAHAVLCTTNSDCPSTPLGGGRTCTKQHIFGIDVLGQLLGARRVQLGRRLHPEAECRLGTCQRPPGVCAVESDCGDDERCAGGRCESTRPTGGGTGIPGEGKRCMPADGSKPADWAKDKNGKPLGACPSGTRCNANGICVRLET